MCGQHLNVLHISEVWTTQHSELPVLTDATVVLILGCFLSTPYMVRTVPKDEDPEYVTPT